MEHPASGGLFELVVSEIRAQVAPGIAWYLDYTSPEGRFSSSCDGFVAGLYTFSDEEKALAFEKRVTLHQNVSMCITRTKNQVCAHMIQPPNGVLTYHLSLKPSFNPEVQVLINILWCDNTWKSGIMLGSIFEKRLLNFVSFKVYETPVCINDHERVLPSEIQDRKPTHTINKIPRALYLEPGCSVEWEANGIFRARITGEAASWLCRIGICVLPSWLFQRRVSSEKITFKHEGIKSLGDLSTRIIGGKPIPTNISNCALRQLNSNSCQCRQRILAWVVPGIPQGSASSSEYEKSLKRTTSCPNLLF